MPPMPGDFDDGYIVNSGSGLRSDGQHLPYPVVGQLPYPSVPQDIDMGDYKDLPPHERPGYVASRDAHDDDSDLAYGTLPLPETRRGRGSSVSSQRAPSPAGYTTTSYHYPASGNYQEPQYTISKPPSGQSQQYQYSQTRPDQPSARYDTQTYSPAAGKQSQSSSFKAQTVDVTPGISKQANLGLNVRMDRLSVSGNRPDTAGTLPPPSPLLEAYRGTYQSVSPMIAPMRLSSDSDLDKLSSLSPGPSSDSKQHRRSRSSTSKIDFISSNSSSEPKKRARLYDAEKDALALNEAISHHRIDVDTICNILPNLTHDQVLELRKEYKKHVKVQGRGINIAKHMKMKLSGNFGKAVYVCALGRYESEGYWANFWYQSHSSRRELLIESLMGRSNAEIRQITESFKDKRYNDDLVRCMEKELKPDKFRVAVLTALEARRQEESEVYPRQYVDKDVDVLNRCLTAKEGGESTMLEIVVRRSDAHLREVLKAYERRFGVNFAREALKKSNNLVGEVICHILNGAINRPARDALLLRHAIDDISTHNRDEELRYELLISRLIRVHWDHAHLARVKREYAEKYHKELDQAVEDAIKGDFREFMYEICKA
ncbi:Annexin, partial [Aureobasidium melanogenum]